MTSVTASQPLLHAAPSGPAPAACLPPAVGGLQSALEPATASQLCHLRDLAAVPSPLGPGRLVTSVRTRELGLQAGGPADQPASKKPEKEDAAHRPSPSALHPQARRQNPRRRVERCQHFRSWQGGPWLPLVPLPGVRVPRQGRVRADHSHRRWKGSQCLGQLVPALCPEPKEAVSGHGGRGRRQGQSPCPSHQAPLPAVSPWACPSCCAIPSQEAPAR